MLNSHLRASSLGIFLGSLLLSFFAHANPEPFIEGITKIPQYSRSMFVHYCEEQYRDQNYADAFKYCNIYANSKDPTVHTILGDLYYRGLGVEQDRELGIHYLQLALAEGNFEVAPQLAYAFLFDPHGFHNEALALSYLQIAQNYHIKEALPLIIQYRFEQNRSDQSKQAIADFKYLKELVEHDLNHEHYVHYSELLSDFYLYGYGVESNRKVALEILEKLDQNYKDPLAQMKLGTIYYEDNDLNQALAYFEKITDQDYIENGANFYYLAKIYQKEKADEPRAIDLYRKASLLNHTKATLELATIYFNKSKQDPKLFVDAIAWADRAIELGDPLGHLYKGRMLLETSKNQEEKTDAIVELKLAASLKQCEAYDLLGDLKLKNNKEKEALAYYQQAYSCGHSKRLGILATLVLKGVGGEFNYNYFSELINLGINAKDPKAYYASALYYLNPPNDPSKRNLSLVVADLTRASSMGSTEAMYKLYEIYSNGALFDKNINLAMSFLKQAAEHGDPKALSKKFKYEFEGIYVKRDLEEANKTALKLLKIDPKLGNELLAYLALEKKDEQNALSYFKEAAKLGSSNALYELGLLYSNNKEIDQDLFKACSYFEKAKEQGIKNASSKLAHCIYNIHNTDLKEALPYLEEVAILGDEEAIDLLINTYSNEDNNAELLKWINVGAKFGYANSLYLLGSSYLNGLDQSLKVNEALGIKYLNLAMNKGSTSAAIELAKYYKEHDLHKNACSIYEKFSYSNDFNFLQNLALCYLNGEGKNLNVKLGENLLLKAYDQTHSEETAFLLGEVYSVTDSSIYDLKKAIEWYMEATDGGSIIALERLGELYTRKSPLFNEQKSFFYYTKAMEAGSTSAMLRVAQDYYFGIGTKQDYQKACDIAKEAVDQALSEANSLLAECYLTGHGREQSFDQAVALLHDGVDKNDAHSALRLAQIYSTGEKVDPDMDFACKYFYKAIIRDQDHGRITREAVKYFIDGNICYQDSLHAYIIFNVLQGLELNLGIKYHNEIARLVKLLTDREIKFAHQIISEMKDYDE